MNKRNKIIFFLILFLFSFTLISYLIYDYLEYKKEIRESYWEIPSQVEYESVENYEIIETEEGKVVVNENAGLSFMVPEGWGVNILPEEYEVEIFTSDMNTTGLGFERIFPIDGCIIRSGIVYFIQDFPGQEQRPQIIRKKIEEKGLLEDIQEVFFINNYSSLKTTRFKDSEFGRVILIETPINNTIYHFGVSFSLNNEEECLEEFHNFLKTVSINI